MLQTQLSHESLPILGVSQRSRGELGGTQIETGSPKLGGARARVSSPGMLIPRDQARRAIEQERRLA